MTGVLLTLPICIHTEGCRTPRGALWRKLVLASRLEVGDTLNTVLLSCLLGGYLRVWASDGHAMFLRVVEAEKLAGLLAAGLVARTGLKSGGFREIGFLNEQRDTLLIQGRPVLKEAKNVLRAAEPLSVTNEELVFDTRAEIFRVELCPSPPPSKELWQEASNWFKQAVIDAVSRGELVVIGTGGWEPSLEPYATACASRDPEGEWLAWIEASPTPMTSLWSDVCGGQPQPTISSPASNNAFSVSGLFLTEAISGWARSPFDVALTFGQNPSGPWEEESAPIPSADF